MNDSSRNACCNNGAKTTALDRIFLSPAAILSISLLFWLLLYSQLTTISKWFAYSLLGARPESRLGQTVEFFIFETPKVLLLLTLVVFCMGVVRTFFSPEQTRKILANRSEFIGNLLAAGLGVFTPFCSCSAIPLFIGFVTAGVPLGVTFSFLISAPMVNEVALVLLFGLFGWKVAMLYLSMGLLIAIISGWIIGHLHLERYVEEWVFTVNIEEQSNLETTMTWRKRIECGREATRDIVSKIWPFIIGGIAIGAGIHGYVPEDFMASIMGKSAWWSVPAAVLLGVPMYSNAAGVIPIVQALLGKGAALGTALAFMMAIIGLSLPEVIILRKVLKPTLIFVFISVVTTGILIVGFLFNIVF